MRRRIPAAAVVRLPFVASVTVSNSPYDPNGETERRPSAPERPPTLTERTAGEYAVRYEGSRLANDLVGSRGYTLDRGDDVWTDRRVASTGVTDEDGYGIVPRCRGGIDDVYRVVQPTGASDTVTYPVSDGATTKTTIDGYPFSPRDELREPPRIEANETA